MSQTAAFIPPLPDFLPPDPEVSDDPARLASGAIATPITPIVPVRFHSVRCGCWLLSYRPAGAPLVAYDGTLRVECHGAGRSASGDLYQRPVIFLPIPPVTPIPHPRIPTVPILRRPILLAGPNPANGIPILARSRYRFYVRVTALPERIYLGNSFTLAFELYRFTAPNTWALDSTLTAQMARMAAPSGYPSSPDYAEGDVKNAAGTVVGRLTMGWLSSYYRRATIEIDTVTNCEQPTQSGAGHTWATVMDAVGWQVNLQLSETNVPEPSGNSWSDAEMHAAMLVRRAATNLDAEWRYHILAVRNLDSTPRGIMYDAFGTDSNNVPREGVGISAHWMIPAGWGLVSNTRFGAAPAPYFRTAVHELGHAFGLYHNTADFGFMCTSDVINAGATPTTPFPNNIQWGFHAEDLKRLRHYPDPFVRPGSVAFGSASNTTPPITPTDLEVEVDELELQVSPLLSQVPYGAPVRVGITLANLGDRAIRVPADLTLKGEFVSGRVIDPSGITRSFRTVVRCIEDQPFQDLDPGGQVTESMVLMRGSEGALFASPGLHEVQVEVHWEVDGMVAKVSGSSTVMVSAAVDEAHAAAAQRVLSTPDAHLVLAIGGDHLVDGVKAIQAALESPVLRPHFAAIEAKRLARRFGKRKPDLKAAEQLLDQATVMSDSELGKMSKMLGDDAGSRLAAKQLGKRLTARTRDTSVHE